LADWEHLQDKDCWAVIPDRTTGGMGDTEVEVCTTRHLEYGKRADISGIEKNMIKVSESLQRNPDWLTSRNALSATAAATAAAATAKPAILTALLSRSTIPFQP